MGSGETINLVNAILLTWKAIITFQLIFTSLVWADRIVVVWIEQLSLFLDSHYFKLKFIKVRLNLGTHLSYALRLKGISENIIHVNYLNRWSLDFL